MESLNLFMKSIIRNSLLNIVICLKCIRFFLLLLIISRALPIECKVTRLIVLAHMFFLLWLHILVKQWLYMLYLFFMNNLGCFMRLICSLLNTTAVELTWNCVLINLFSSNLKFIILQLIIAATLCTINCAQLNNNYLPPAGAGGSSGASVPGGLQAPRAPGNNALGGISPGRPQAPSPNRPASPSSGASPSSPSGPPIEIISYESVNNGDGSYKWR